MLSIRALFYVVIKGTDVRRRIATFATKFPLVFLRFTMLSEVFVARSLLSLRTEDDTAWYANTTMVVAKFRTTVWAFSVHVTVVVMIYKKSPAAGVVGERDVTISTF